MSTLSLPSVAGKSFHHQILGTPPLKRVPSLRKGCVAVRASLSSSKEKVLKDFHACRALKIISGLQNFNKESVAAVVTAADKGGATHVDIACNPELVKLAQKLTSLPICVSSVEPEAFLPAVEAGADMVEIGNYDSFYETGMKFSPDQATPTLASAYSISRAVNIPVLCSSGLSSVTAPMALAAGAAGVGVGSAVNKLNDVVAMIAEVKSLANALRLERISVRK